jgi:hypothetical protein
LVSESSRIEALWHWVCQILSRTCAVILMWDIVGLIMINLKSCPDLTATSLLFKKHWFSIHHDLWWLTPSGQHKFEVPALKVNVTQANIACILLILDAPNGHQLLGRSSHLVIGYIICKLG